MKTSNPFPYTLDNKRYHTWNYYLKNTYHQKVFKVPLNANFSCPNRDGTCGVGGCRFCGSLGSGEYAGNIHDDLAKQFKEVHNVMKRKWPDGLPMAYFQAYTNTYAPLETLKAYFTPFIEREDIVALAIATRADCLEDDKIAYLQSLTKKKAIWIELGLQSIHDSSAKAMNRGHDYATFLDCIERLKHTDLKICVHLINSLPNENKEMMIETAKQVGQLPIHAIKIHMLHVCKHTQLANDYQLNPFPLLSLEEYVDVVIQQLEHIPANIIIQRLTGDGMKELLIAPHWTLNKTNVLNSIDKEMVKRNTWQGKFV
ncbi:MAG: TIGR01212 family radical SAM protein [Erysipelotrichia bacterium]|nr:TIGR01212 family radical SAM protein [Erysipelotrichia bacterium]